MPGVSKRLGPMEKVCAYCGQTFPRDPRCTWAYWARQKFCGAACSGKARSESAAAARAPEREAFFRWVEKSDGCWLWMGARDKDGYGIFSFAKKTRRASVVSLALDGRAPAPGQYACHTCDNPPCVNPAHLYPGTPTQNMADAIARGRVAVGERRRGAKLTAEAVRAIRASPLPAPEVARQFGVSASNICMIRAGRTWRHV